MAKKPIFTCKKCCDTLFCPVCKGIGCMTCGYEGICPYCLGIRRELEQPLSKHQEWTYYEPSD